MMTDESTDISTEKASCIVVRYFNQDSGRIVSSFYELVNVYKNDVDSATASVIFDAIINAFKTQNIPMSNIIGFGSDGCNTMMGDQNSVKSRFIDACPGIHVTKCVCHSLHLCASEACKSLPRHVEDMPRDIFSFFKSSAKRKSIFQGYQQFLNLKVHRMLHPSQTRWLSLHPVVKRISEQWGALRLFFTDMVQIEKIASADRILRSLNDNQVRLFFYFLDWILPKFNKLNAYFQTENTVVTQVHGRMTMTMRDILSSFLKSGYISKTALNAINTKDEASQLPNEQMYLGSDVLTFSSKLENDATTVSEKYDIQILIADFRSRCRLFMQTACAQMQKRFNFDDKVWANISIFDPSELFKKEMKEKYPSLQPISLLLPRCMQQLKMQDIDDEWRTLPFVCIPDEILMEKEVDIFWGKMLQHKGDSGVCMFANLEKFVLNILSIAHSNASCERVFSKVNNIKTKYRNKITTATLTKLILAKESISEKGGCQSFEPTSNMRAKMNKHMYISNEVDDELEDCFEF